MQGLVSKGTALGHAPRVLLALGSTLLVWSCGDDDQPADAGTDDAATAGSGGSFTRPRPDGGAGSDPVPECDRFDPLACGAGQRCQLVIRRAAGEAQFLIYPGCVEGGAVRAAGDPCEPWGGGFIPYRAEGLEDELYVDPCDEGLICAADPDVRGHFTCQRACQSGFYEGFPPVFCSADSYCVGPQNAPLEEWCIKGDSCDPTDPAGCGPGVGCYLGLNDTASGALTLCLPTLDPPLEDGAACRTFRDCRPGSSCWGPPGVPPSRWTQGDFRCRRSCIVGQDLPDEDGGVVQDEDAGVSGGRCNACVSLESAGVSVPDESTPIGLCQ